MLDRKVTIGRNLRVDLPGYAKGVPAKVDTGADSSSVWASDVRITPEGLIQFVLFGPESPLYSGEIIETDAYTVAVVRSTTGHEEIRYRVVLPVRVKRKLIKAVFNLSNRSLNKFPILIGRRTLSKKFVVDVSEGDESILPIFKDETKLLNEELRGNPHAFYSKYHGRDL